MSACNPPCAAGDTCQASGECVNPEREREQHSIRRHDGFYLRFELGAGYFSGSRVSETIDAGDANGDVSGVAQVGGLMLGGTIANGLVLGGGAWGTNAPRSEYDGQVYQDFGPERGTVIHRTAAVDLASTSVIGPFLAWYPDPTKGFNAELALGLAVATIGGNDSNTFWLEDYEGVGWGLQLGVGYDFWVGEQWSLGILARASYVNVGDDGKKDTLSAWAPALAGAVTFH